MQPSQVSILWTGKCWKLECSGPNPVLEPGSEFVLGFPSAGGGFLITKGLPTPMVQIAVSPTQNEILGQNKSDDNIPADDARCENLMPASTLGAVDWASMAGLPTLEEIDRRSTKATLHVADGSAPGGDSEGQLNHSYVSPTLVAAIQRWSALMSQTEAAHPYLANNKILFVHLQDITYESLAGIQHLSGSAQITTIRRFIEEILRCPEFLELRAAVGTYGVRPPRSSKGADSKDSIQDLFD